MRIVFVLLLVIIPFIFADDYYKTLGVSRTATEQEIKRAYKKLALKFHPDRNKSPNAQPEFVKISKAYETLKDSTKRNQYDRYGDESSRPQGGGFGFHGGFDPFDMFRDFFNDNPFGFVSQIKEMDYAEFDLLYNMRKHPKTHSTYLILLHPSRCGMCDQILKIFEDIRDDLKGFVKIRKMQILHRDMIPASVTHLPAVIAVNRGNIRSFYGPIASENIKDFVHEVIPKYYVAQILDLKEFENFKAQKKPRVVIFSKWKNPTILETELAEKFRYFLRMGHIHIESRTHWAFKSFNELKIALPAAMIMNGNKTTWHFNLGKAKMMKLLKKTRVRIPNLWNNEMMFDYCYDHECFLYGTNNITQKKIDLPVLKQIDGRIAFVKNFDLLKEFLDIKGDRLFVSIDLRQRTAKIWPKNDKMTIWNVMDWYHYGKVYKYRGFPSIEHPGWEWLQIMLGMATTVGIGFVTLVMGIICWC